MRKLLIVLFCSTVLAATVTKSQVVSWVDHIGGSGVSEPRCMVSDALENIYIGGITQDTTVFLSQSPVFQIPVFGESKHGMVCKYNTNGELVWSRVFGGSNDVVINTIDVDGAANVYVGGHFQGTVDFDPGLDSNWVTSVSGSDGYISKFDNNGVFQWVWHFGDVNYDHIVALLADSVGNCYATGNFQNEVDVDPGSNQLLVGTDDWGGNLIIKLLPTGQPDWAFGIRGAGSDIKWSPQGNVIVTGNFCDSADFDPGPDQLMLYEEGWSSGCIPFVAEYETDGSVIWANKFGFPNFYNSPVIHVSEGNIYAGGRTLPTEMNPGNYDGYLFKLDLQGNQIWEKRIDGNGSAIIKSIQTKDNRLFLGVICIVTADFDPGPLVANFTSSSGYNPFFVEWDTSGNYVGVEHLETSIEGYMNSIHLLNATQILAAGAYIGNIDLGFGSSMVYPPTGPLDGYLMKINIEGPIGIGKTSSALQLRAYPNPATDIVQVVSLRFKIVSLKLLDMRGVTHRNYQLSNINAQLDISGLSSGIYALQAKLENGAFVNTKIVKE